MAIAETKLREVAFSFDPKKFTNMDTLRGFYTYFTPRDMAARIEKCFNIHLTTGEAAAMTSKFRTRDHEPSVDGGAFIKYFYELHAIAWKQHQQDKRLADYRNMQTKSKRPVPYLPCQLGR